MLARVINVLLLPVLLLSTIAASFAVSPDPRLLQLVPPGSSIVAGMRSPSEPNLPNNFLLISHRNRIDMDDFLALTGADPDRLIHEVLFVAGDVYDATKEHSLVASGMFGRSSIFRYADGVRAYTLEYRGIPVMVVLPLERERKYFADVRWLALLDSNIAVFGTAPSVQMELDRYLDHSRIDTVLWEKLKQLNKRDITWSVMGTPLPGEHLEKIFGELNPEFGALLAAGGIFELGIECETDRVILQYELIPTAVPATTNGKSSLPPGEQGNPSIVQSAFVARSDDALIPKTIRGSLKVSRNRYETWLAKMTEFAPVRDRAH